MSAVKPVPDGFHTITPHIVVKGAAKAIEFYKKAFGAEENGRHQMADGTIMHATLKIGDSMIMLNDEFPEMNVRGPLSIGGTAVTIHLYVPDVDKAFDRAVKAGAQVTFPLADQFWGDRYGIVSDPFGHHWSLATHKHDLTPEQVDRAMSQAAPPPSAKKK